VVCVEEPDDSLEKISKIKKIVKNANLHAEEALKPIVEKIKAQYTADIPNAFWSQEQYFVDLPYDDNFKGTPLSAAAIPMSPEEQKMCREEIQELLDRKLIETSRSPWASPAFYVNKHSEKKIGKPCLVINYKKLNKALLPLRYPIPNKEALFQKIRGCNVFSKFDMKNGFWQIGISPKDRFKTGFTNPQGQFQWQVMPFSLKNAPSKFQKRMEDIFNDLDFIIVYIEDLLICSRDLKEHAEHLEQFYQKVYKHGLALSPKKMEIGKTRIEFLGMIIAE
jgi:hypothetical protein